MTSPKDWSPRGHQYFYIAVVGYETSPYPILFSFPSKLSEMEFQARWERATEEASVAPEWNYDDVTRILERKGFIRLETAYLTEVEP